MNHGVMHIQTLVLFLNGVCRHELELQYAKRCRDFLNGVCRHELGYFGCGRIVIFLNGVCRHERNRKSDR